LKDGKCEGVGRTRGQGNKCIRGPGSEEIRDKESRNSAYAGKEAWITVDQGIRKQRAQ
jgi:hypothetical protein